MSNRIDESHPLFMEYVALLDVDPASTLALSKIDEIISLASRNPGPASKVNSELSRLKVYKLSHLASCGRLKEADEFLRAERDCLEPAALVSGAEIASTELGNVNLALDCLKQAERKAGELESGERSEILQQTLWALAEILENSSAPPKDFEYFWGRLRQLEEHSLQTQTIDLLSAWRRKKVFRDEVNWLSLELLKHTDDPDEANLIKQTLDEA